MIKRILLSVVLVAALAGGVFAQTHWASLEIKGPGAGLRYEYVITPSFTIGGYFSYSAFAFSFAALQDNSVEFGATARWYPFARRLFTDISLGLNIFRYREEREFDTYPGPGPGPGGGDNNEWEYREGSGLCISPGFGWTIDVGKMGGFFISPGVKFPFTLGSQFNIAIAPYFGLGAAF